MINADKNLDKKALQKALNKWVDSTINTRNAQHICHHWDAENVAEQWAVVVQIASAASHAITRVMSVHTNPYRPGEQALWLLINANYTEM